VEFDWVGKLVGGAKTFEGVPLIGSKHYVFKVARG